VRRAELVPELQAIGADLVVVDEEGALEKIRARVGDGRLRLAIDGVSGKSSAVIAGALSGMGPLSFTPTWEEGRSRSARSI